VTVTYSGVSVSFSGLPIDETINMTGPENILSWTANTAITFTVGGSFDSYAWDVDGKSVDGTTASLTLHAQAYATGTHIVTVKVTKAGKTYAKTARFLIEE
jgi:hypothetical protein